MIGNGTTARELWIRLACLAVSAGLHAGLVAVGWKSLEAWRGKDPAIIVTLGEPPTSTTPRTGAVMTATRGERRLFAPSRVKPAVSGRVGPHVPASPETVPACAVPVAETVEKNTAVLPVVSMAERSLPAGGDSPGIGGGGHGSAAAGDDANTGTGTGGEGNDGKTLNLATPRYDFNPKPDYPVAARRNRWQGAVRVRARVTAGGTVENVALEQSSGQALLDRSALDSVRRWRFIPASRGGLPVACEVSIPVVFRLAE